MKKYATRIVIAAFLILSVVTAYNIRVQESKWKEENTNQTGATETTQTSAVYEWVTVTEAPEEQTTETQKATYQGEQTLRWPVQGNILLPYSMDRTVYYKTLDQYACNDGLLLKAKVGTEVVAAADGTVVSVGKSNRYGTMVILDLGNDYEITYGQVGNTTWKTGDVVKAGEVIGKVANPTRSFQKEGSHVYVKMTKNGKPVNPETYFEAAKEE